MGEGGLDSQPSVNYKESQLTFPSHVFLWFCIL